jgi:hypothetical protein
VFDVLNTESAVAPSHSGGFQRLAFPVGIFGPMKFGKFVTPSQKGKTELACEQVMISITNTAIVSCSTPTSSTVMALVEEVIGLPLTKQTP